MATCISTFRSIQWILVILFIGSASRAEVPRIHNTLPAGPPRSVELEEIWRVGGDQGDILFGTVTEATTDSDGNVYILDTQLCHVVVISPSGEYLRTISGEGDGPGEVRRPRDLVFLDDGTLGILELFPAKFIKLSSSGEPRGILTVGGDADPQTGFTSASRCIYRGGTLMIAGQRLVQTDTGQSRVMYLSRLNNIGAEVVRFCEATMVLNFEKLHFVERELEPGFFLGNAVGPDGRVYSVQSWNKYAVDVYQPDGTLERIIERDFENRKRTEDELRRVNALFDASDQNTPYEATREIEPCPPAISDLHVDSGGNLWVLNSRGAENPVDGAMLSYDLFDPQGEYLEQVSIICDGDPAYDGLEFLPDERVLLIKGYVLSGMSRTDLGNIAFGEEGEASPLEIICCRMTSP
ncbi:MAG: hypothetical protein KJ970_20430 [Candidatus Eisenbacteria bacterium]|uniref:6-bladed beta-propeller n=1 Tax=Eiseniibacteriota bacterium TaxID=2212470 RepID=A0A948W5G7_UNCEI|nr:hypothetical protein [Candidatus Eisenbacteria bacterium]MBU1948582.1 hypothetical protein [Candidatus Eisenbacteria bacterium]MBU2693292.1 hypothetical protein [Candidatus Eisenbacteria bacterium]